MKRTLFVAVFASLIGLLFAVNQASAGVGIVVRIGPPAPRHEVIVERPWPDGVWIAGYWGWRPVPGRYVWIPGRWEHPRRGYAWVDGRWYHRRDGWHRAEGHWQRAPMRRGDVVR